MSKIVLSIFVFIVGINMCAQQQQYNLWEGEIPYNKKGISVKEIVKNYSYHKITVPQLYHYPSKVQGDKKPAIIVIPGGGYVREAFNHEGFMAGEWFSDKGVETFVLKYRLPDRELVENASYVPLMDAQQAIYWVRKNADKYGVDPNNIGVIGFSAGGHLAASASTLFKEPVNKQLKSADVRPDYSILMYPVISMDDAITHKGSKENLLGKNPTSQMVEKFTLENQVSNETPITLMIHSSNDGGVVVANTENYANSLVENGVDVTKIILPIGGHGFGFRKTDEISYWTGYLDIWLNANVINKK